MWALPPPPGEAWAAPRLMARLGVDTGVTLEVGAAELKLTRVLDFRPDEGWSFVDLAPTLLINEADLAATQLIQPGSRVAYRMLFAGDRGAVDQGMVTTYDTSVTLTPGMHTVKVRATSGDCVIESLTVDEAK